jgi:hypothetical protein
MNSPGGTEQICYEFNRYLIAEGERVGDALYDGKYYATSVYGWDRVYEYMNLYNYNLYGDPALELAGAMAGVVLDPVDGRRVELRLLPAKPNPFASSTSLRFVLAAAGLVRVSVNDVSGRQVAVLADGEYEAGEFTVTWDGRGEGGQNLAPGLYFAVVESGNHQAVRKMVYLR